MSMPRPEYPRPQFVRDEWLCLNGTWQFEIDAGDSGVKRGLLERELSGKILVPFCPESKLSGIGNVDFLNAVWYRRTVEIPAGWPGRRVLLYFQAVDYDTTVWVNGQEVARHRGGWTGFTCDLEGIVKAGETAIIVVRARDDTRHPMPAGKQSAVYENHGCHYTRTTGIWQTVWLEPVPMLSLARPRITPDLGAGRFHVVQPLYGHGQRRAGMRVRAVLRRGDEIVAEATAEAHLDFAPALSLQIPQSQRRLWTLEDPFLYDLELSLINSAGAVVDRATSYAGLRGVSLDGKAVLLNGQPVFQRLVLDQGYYPDGILTAPCDQALIDDIVLSKEVGFNGARLHQKVFEERFLYHADRLGYLCWGEFGDWGLDRAKPQPAEVAQWLEALHRDYNHPCIIGWCGLNETAQKITDENTALNDLTRAMFLAVKAIDSTRPVLDASGYSHRLAESDIYDSHDYDQDPSTFAHRHARTLDNQPFANPPPAADPNRAEQWSIPHRGQPCFVSEFGGALWNPHVKPGDPSWGYGQRPTTLEEFYTRFDGLCSALLQNPGMFGYCYTQLTDVFQEQNGLYFFDRKPKFDAARLRAIQSRPAVIESGK